MESQDTQTVNFSEPLIKEGVLLSLHNTFKIGGKAKYFAEVTSPDGLKQVGEFIKQTKVPFFILGAGSNTVFNDGGFDGVVIKSQLKGIEIVSQNESEVFVRAMSGESWDEFVNFCTDSGFFSIENLTHIPGTVGGAVVQNIGAYGVEVEKSVESVEVFDFETGHFETIPKKDLDFGYRYSRFKTQEFKNKIIVSVLFKLSKIDNPNISYKDLSSFFSDKKENISASSVRNALKEIRSKKFPDLNVYGTAGSFFKNIVTSEEIYKNIQKQFPDVPVFVLESGKVKIPAGFVLDKICGLKGFGEGNFKLYENQSLVVVNTGNGTTEELKSFIEKIKKIVLEKIGVELEEEVIVLRDKWAGGEKLLK